MMLYALKYSSAWCEFLYTYSSTPAQRPFHRVLGLALQDRLVRAVRVDLVGCLGIEPVIGAAEAETLRRYDATWFGAKLWQRMQE